MLDMKNNVAAKSSIVPAVRNSTVNGTGIDLANRDMAIVVFHSGALTDGTHTPKVQESDDNSTFTDVAAADQEGTLAAITANAVQWVGYKGKKRYIRAVVTSSGTTGCAYGASMIVGQGRKAPVT
jgi:hypothetical protein